MLETLLELVFFTYALSVVIIIVALFTAKEGED